MDLLLFCLPWLLVGLYMALFVRIPPGLSSAPQHGSEKRPSVSVIVPARNEAANIPALLSSLTALEYPDYEVLVVDDRSDDGTPELVVATHPGNAREVHLIRGESLPEGWFGKPWACFQGARAARGEFLLFTDADTQHEPSLLSDAMATMDSEGADVLTLIGRQVMGSFWERLLQPQFFMLLAARFPRVGKPRSTNQWRHAIANGQYLLFRKEVYEELGGHGVVRGEVVEDMRLAQLLVQGGWRLVVREGRGLKTRMYRSLGGLIEGWGKNIATGALQATGGWLLPVILPLSLVVGLCLWLLPPAALVWALMGKTGGLVFQFGALTTGFGVLYWALATGVMRANPLYGLLYPLGSVLAAVIFVRSWMRGGQIEWKGRHYHMPRESRTFASSAGAAGYQPEKGRGPHRGERKTP